MGGAPRHHPLGQQCRGKRPLGSQGEDAPSGRCRHGFPSFPEPPTAGAEIQPPRVSRDQRFAMSSRSAPTETQTTGIGPAARAGVLAVRSSAASR